MTNIKPIRPHVVCTDGFRVSVQTGWHAYCTPRDNSGPYTHVECGYPSEKEDMLIPYAEEADIPTRTVYGWVPLSVVNEVIARHGGSRDWGENEQAGVL